MSSAENNRKGSIFVIQKHDASTLHYDFRLEMDGVLKSWAVPKGPSTDPSEKRLAIPTPDHDIDHADFEGVIPDGKAGAGPVLIWDRGRYENLAEDDEGNGVPSMHEAFDQGRIRVRLNGKKLRGGYALQRTGNGDPPNWLLVKMDDEAADARRNPVSTEPESVVSGRTIEQIAGDDSDSEKDSDD